MNSTVELGRGLRVAEETVRVDSSDDEPGRNNDFTAEVHTKGAFGCLGGEQFNRD